MYTTVHDDVIFIAIKMTSSCALECDLLDMLKFFVNTMVRYMQFFECVAAWMPFALNVPEKLQIKILVNHQAERETI